MAEVRGNPVLSRNSANFRDPKVFRYRGAHGPYWVMAAVEAQQQKVILYRSNDLKSWDLFSAFGPANADGGEWECPDLFPLPVDGNPENIKWVLIVNVNPGAVAGGSGGQYFIGQFDGSSFVPDNDSLAAPSGLSALSDPRTSLPLCSNAYGWTGAATATPPSLSTTPPITDASSSAG